MMYEEFGTTTKQPQRNTPVDNFDLLSLTAYIAAGHLSANTVDIQDIAGVIHRVYATLSTIMTNVRIPAATGPAVPVQESIQPDYIVCLEDGKKLKMLKRYLRTAYNMTPAQYRSRWGLSSSYPMVAPNYAIKRSQLAKSIGLGIRPHVLQKGHDIRTP
ncbi:MAG: MucR family transcriptional regulator [Holosporales bacterium]|jgi:predicted transcriptional regulator|nr:MucR family transcriptional regulator [Holosporales bacterium]